jgi:hypothetical protein
MNDIKIDDQIVNSDMDEISKNLIVYFDGRPTSYIIGRCIMEVLVSLRFSPESYEETKKRLISIYE